MRDTSLRQQLARSFDHGQMKNAAQVFVARKAGMNAWHAVLPAPPSAALVDVASAFIELQEKRHEADYVLARSFTRSEAEALVTQAKAAFTSWGSVRGTEEAEVFILALLVRGRG